MSKKQAIHHVALRVNDLERAKRFYEQVFGGKVLIDVPLKPANARAIFGATEETTGRSVLLDVDGWGIELFEFHPNEPLPQGKQMTLGLMHVCFYVEDVAGTAELVEEHGGSLCFPIMPWGAKRFVYVKDPDGHVIELLDTRLEEIVGQLTATGPLEV